jgi:hypothetical protein
VVRNCLRLTDAADRARVPSRSTTRLRIKPRPGATGLSLSREKTKRAPHPRPLSRKGARGEGEREAGRLGIPKLRCAPNWAMGSQPVGPQREERQRGRVAAALRFAEAPECTLRWRSPVHAALTRNALRRKQPHCRDAIGGFRKAARPVTPATFGGIRAVSDPSSCRTMSPTSCRSVGE